MEQISQFTQSLGCVCVSLRELKSRCRYLKLTEPVEDGQRPSKVSLEATPEGKEENEVVLLSNHEEPSLPTNNDSDEEASD